MGEGTRGWFNRLARKNMLFALLLVLCVARFPSDYICQEELGCGNPGFLPPALHFWAGLLVWPFQPTNITVSQIIAILRGGGATKAVPCLGFLSGSSTSPREVPGVAKAPRSQANQPPRLADFSTHTSCRGALYGRAWQAGNVAFFQSKAVAQAGIGLFFQCLTSQLDVNHRVSRT